MRTWLRGKITLLFMTCAVLLAVPAIALADDLRNDLDNSFEADFEVLSLPAGGASDDVNIVLQTQGSDGDGGCNLDGSEKIEVQAVSSSSAASVKWADTGNDKVEFLGCNAASSENLTVTPGSIAGTADITFKITGATDTPTPGVYTVTSTGGGTYDVRTAQFRVNVTAPPNNPPDVSVTGVEHGAVYEYNAVPDAGCNVTDDNDTDPTTDPVTDSTGLNSYGLGSETVTCSYTDGGGLEETASATYTIVDTTAPVLDLPANITREATSSAGAEVDFSADVSATDELYGSVDVTCDPPSGGTFALGTTTVDCSATDGSGNTAEGSFDVTVEDTTAPVLDLPANITEEATSSAGAVVNYSATAEDAVDGSFDADCAPASGATFPLGTTTVDCSATDAAGNTSTGSFDVTVEDTTAPSLNLPGNQTVEATGPGGATVTYTADADDLVDGNIAADCTPASGATFPLGTTTVECSATDAAGNTANGTFDVTVQDTTAPTLTLPDNITEEATGPNGAAVSFNATADDLVDGEVDVTCDPASGSMFPIDTTTVECSATDAAGNTANGNFTVTVQDTTAPTLTLPNNITKVATSASGATATFTTSATDLVDGSVSVNCTKGTPPVAVSSGDMFPVGTTTVNCSATDAAGNTANGNFTVTVSYGWSGFLQPINTLANMPTNYKQSVFKTGSTVPVKFQLTGASAGITDGNFYLKYIRTGNGDGLGETEVVAAATGNTGTQFRYDATAGQYIFNWSTKGISPAGNFEVRVYTDAAMTNLLGSQSIELKK
jgi:hypothetical protein